MGLTALKLFLIPVLVFANGFFVAAEFAIVKVRGTRIESLVRKGSRRARVARHIIQHLDAYLSATQLGITITSILLGWVGEETMRHAIVEPALASISVTNPTVVRTLSFFLGTGIIVFLHVVLGELVPKSLAIQQPDSTSLWVAYPLKWFYLLMYPAIASLNNTANFFLRLAGIQPAGEGEEAHSEEELRLLFAESARSGVLTSDKRDLLENVFDLSRRIVRQIMVPRTEIVAFSLRKSLAENLRLAHATAHSRYPLVDGDLDNVVGIIHMKDLFWRLKGLEHSPAVAPPNQAAGGPQEELPPSGAGFLKSIAREVLFVPDAMRIENLLREFQEKRIHLAVVVDEFGATMGMVTFENVIEAIVGQVQDEFDEEAPLVRKVSATEFVLDGRAPLPDVNDALGTACESADVDTIGGFMINELGRIPRTGDSLAVDNVELTVTEMKGPRIHRIQAHLVSADDAGAPPADAPPAENPQ